MDTPETDKAIFRYGCRECGPVKEEGVEPSFARKLENQRDRAIEILRWFAEGDEPIGSDADLIFKMNKKIKDFLA